MTIFWRAVEYAFIILLSATIIEMVAEVNLVLAIGGVTWIGAMVHAVEIMFAATDHSDPPDPGPPGGMA